MMPMQAPPQPPHQHFNSNPMSPPPSINGRPAPGGVSRYPAPNGASAMGFYPPNGVGGGGAPHNSYSSSPLDAPAIQLQDAPLPSNNNNQDASFASSSSSSQPSGSRFRRVRPDTEEIKRVGRSHYVELLGFLRSHLAKVEQTAPRSNAREKLTRLSKQQFTELSTDVYDELMRRQNNAKNGSSQPFLAVRDEFHPKRNQARQKLATLPRNRFKDLASDVFFELERRFPELKQEFRPEAIAREQEREQQMRREAEAALQRKDSVGQPQPSMSDRIVPAKSTLVEEDIAVPYSANGSKLGGNRSHDNDGFSERVSSPLRDSTGSNGVNGILDNRSTMYSQASSIGTGFFNGYTGSIASPNLGRGSAFEPSDASSTAMEKMRSDYELRIAKLQQQVSSLESQIADAGPRARKADELVGRNEELDRQLTQLRTELDEAKQKHQDDRELHRTVTAKHESELDSVKRELLKREQVGGHADFEALQKEHGQQAEVVNELKQEVSNLLEELRELSARNDEMQADRDNDVMVIKDLNAQMANYKRLYETAKTELRNLKATSQLYVQPPKADDFLPASDKGAIVDVNLTAFQSSIDELLAAARSKTPGNVLLSMKTVVLSTTLVTDDVAKYEQIPSNLAELSPEDQEQLMALKSKCSATLNNLMTACRNHASSHGLSPVSLLDAAASHVSATIVDLVKLLKVRKASKTETDEFQAKFGEDTVAARLKPLHINAQAANREASATLSPNTANSYSFASLNPSSAVGDDRFSPRIRNSPTMGRYSPIGYKAETIRKDSGGDHQWRSRATSISSVGSANASTPNMTSVPEMPNLHGAKRFVSDSSSSPLAGARTTTTAAAGDANGILPRSGAVSPSPLSSDSQVQRSETYDSLQTVTSASGSGFGSQNGEENWSELRNYIEVQTEAIVHSIQALLSAIREGAQGVQLSENLTQITTIVSSIVAISKGNLPAKSKAEGERILDELTDNCDKLSEMQSHESFDKSTKSTMASASYGVAKGLKALNALFNDADLSQ
ncbi:related to SPA2 protein [Sporisorium reilianum f. sp. reilianum]|uniref:Related to SPA2 protein n=1 Tax=Sporisorium reilianum f. sp. reilianum TaxID=72559 RepID=A0A2N8UJ10_9BASI|nr:related to SPA2 protein [Sporisorium reilianum f. sp. reilianum]